MAPFEVHLHGDLHININTAAGARSFSPRDAHFAGLNRSHTPRYFGQDEPYFAPHNDPAHGQHGLQYSSTSTWTGQARHSSARHSSAGHQTTFSALSDVQQAVVHHHSTQLLDLGGGIDGSFTQVNRSFARGAMQGQQRRSEASRGGGGQREADFIIDVDINLNTSRGNERRGRRYEDDYERRGRRREDDSSPRPRKRVETTFIEEGNTADGWVRRVKKRVEYE